MLNRATRARRNDEHGQTLIMALAFVAFFSLVTVAVLRVADVATLQHVRTEATAASDASAEGGAAYAAADATRSDVPLACAAGSTGSLTMASGDSVTYTVNGCNPGLSAGGSGSGPGSSCVLCVLNLQPTPAAKATRTVLSLSEAHGTPPYLTTSGGDVAVNGSIASGTALTASGTGAKIDVLTGASSSGCTCSPAPTTMGSAIADPLASLGAPSPAVTNQPTGCPSWNASNGCTASYTSNATIHPGLWSSLSVSGGGTVTMASGVYVFTGPIAQSGGGVITGTGVTVFLTCQGYGPSGTLCASSGASGGWFSLSGNSSGSVSITAPGSSQYTAANVSILADPNLLDPGGAAACAAGSGNCVFTSSGHGAGVAGTVDLRQGGMSVQGNGSASLSSGRLIVNSLYLSVSGNSGSGLSLSGTVAPTSSCSVFDTAVGGTTSSTSGTGRAIVQSQCGAGTSSGVVDFNYKS